MKIRLVDKTIYTVSRAEIVNSRLEIDFIDKTAEEVQEIFSVPANLETIELLTDSEEKFGELPGWSVLGGVLLNNETKTVILTKAIDVTEQRLTSAEADALAAKTATEAQEKEIEQLKEEIASGGAGVDPALFSASVVVARANAQALEDEQALQAKALYPSWKETIGQTVEKGFKFVYEEVLYKTIQDSLLIQEQYVPGQGTESLYTVIDETHAGTQEDPIPYSGNMELEQGKYYSQGGVTYLCNRDTGQAVFQPLSDLIGIYVEVVEE